MISQFTKYLLNDRSTFLVSITIPVEIIVIIIINNAMAHALKTSLFVEINVFKNMKGKTDQIIRMILLFSVGQST